MPHVLENLEPAHRVVELILHGSLEDPDVLGLLAAALAMQRETGIGDTLIDAAEVSHGLTNKQIIDLAETLAQLGVPDDWRQAIVKPHDLMAAVDISLWQAACSNRGMTVRVFPDRESALAWLVSG